MISSSSRLAVPGELAGRRPTWIEIDLDALVANFNSLAGAAGGRPVWCVVKANAYGHGAVECSLALTAAGAAGLVVALPEEGIALRRAGIEIPILLSGPLPADGAQVLVEHRLTPAISRPEDLLLLQAAAASARTTAEFHLELDSGMTRMGLDPDNLESFMAVAAGCGNCRLQAVLSHLASVSRPADDSAQRQQALFGDLMKRIRGTTAREVPAHMASSPALCGFPGAAFDMVRPGLLLYGVSPAPSLLPPAPLRPVLSLRASIILRREVGAGVPVGYEGTWSPSAATQVVVISAGYADGLLRDVAGRAEALMGGKRLPYVGSVNMDLAQLDAGNCPEADPGDVVTLIGADGGDSIRVEELAERTGRTAYEWLTGLGSRVPRLIRPQGHH
jgi:alanine racemase